MKYPPLGSDFFAGNRARLVERLEPDSIAVFHSADVPPLCADGVRSFVQNSDLFYLTGADQEESILLLQPGATDPSQREILFVRETSKEIAIWEGQKLTQEKASEISGIANVQWTDRFEHEFRRAAHAAKRIYLNHDEHPRRTTEVENPDDRFRKRCQSLFPLHHYERVAPILHDLRFAKQPIEIERTRRACEITEGAFRRVLPFVKPGVMEYEVEAEFAHEFLRHGSRGFAYEPIVAAGKNNCVLHYLDNDQPCRDGELLLLDVGAEYSNYNADMTRTIPVNGRFTDRQRAVYNAVLRVFRACIDDLIRPGVEIKAYAKQVARLMEDEIVGLGLLDAETVRREREDESLKEEAKSYRTWYMHGVSHSLGLDVHDVGPVDPHFVENMLVTVEPGIYLREEGFGVRLENDIVVRADGNLDLMADIPIEADEIEALMQG